MSLSGLCFAITGTLSVGRSEFEELITSNGGTVAKSVTNKCTHLISAVSGTKKCQDAEAKGVTVVDEDWVRNRINNGGGKKVKAAAAAPSTPPAAKKAKTTVKPEASPATAGDGGDSLSGLVFAITGTLSVKRAEFEKLIVGNGGRVSKTVTNSVTHLVSSETGTQRCNDAEAKGVKIVDEDWVRDRIENGCGKVGGSDDDAGEHDEEEDEEEEYEEAPEGGASEKLVGMVFAITGKLSVPRVEFEEFIKSNGGTVTKSVTRAVTHLISPLAEQETKKCQDALAKGIEIVDEDFVRELCVVEEEDEEDEDEDGNDDKEEKECYLTEMLNMGADDEGFPPFSKKAIGMKLAISEESTNPNLDSDATYVVVSYRPVAGTTGLMKIKNLDNEEADLIEADFTVLIDDFRTLPPKAATELWDKYQNRKISEGVWEGVAAPSLLAEINALVDALAAQEPVDFHPGTKEVVRDLVHPSLFPLLSDPSTRDVTKKNFWGRPHEASRFQWLPAEVEIDESGNPHFASDINNLDRSKYSALYGGLEGLFKELLPGFQKVWQYARSMTFTEEEEDWDEDVEVEEPDLINFHGSTLQAVVKIADYEFQPGAEFDGVWHYEGMSHENIVMTGLFYPNSDEDLKGGLEFKRMFNDSEAGKILFGVNQQRARWFEEMIQMGFIPLGQTTTETGKLLVFPNCHAHRVMKMVNNTPNVLRRRLVVFFIIDPNDRIPSSRDFPPLPRQISLEQALADRLELMQERKQAKQSLNPREIELCEH